MSEKYTTAELIDRICWKDDDRVLGPNDPCYPICEDTKNAIIAKLEAADALYAIDKRMVVKTMTPPGVTIAEAAKWVKAIQAYKEA